MEIAELITQPESKTLEFKQDLSSLIPVLKTIVAFANTAGGILVIGCSSQGKLIGLKDIFRNEEKLANAIADSIHPPFLPELEIATIQGKDLLIVKVAHWKGPFYLKQLGIPKGVYVRLGSTNRVAGAELLSELQRSTLVQSFDQQPLSELAKESLDFERMERIFKQCGKEMSHDKLRSLDILVPHARSLVPSIGGIVLFGKPAIRERLFPDARVSCARFIGDNKAHILDRYEVEGTILDAIESVPKFIARNTRLAAEIQGIQRRDVPEYSPVAVREVLINALVHTDYSIQGSHIQIAIFDDRLEIQNPGMLPFGFTLEDLKTGASRIRNRVIARVFRELHFMEAWGSGYRRCIENCRIGNYGEPTWQELGTTMRVTFYPHTQTQMLLAETPYTYSVGEVVELHERQQTILTHFRQKRSLAFKEIFKLTKSIPERTLRYDLAQLRSKGFLISRGKGRATVWRLVID